MPVCVCVSVSQSHSQSVSTQTQGGIDVASLRQFPLLSTSPAAPFTFTKLSTVSNIMMEPEPRPKKRKIVKSEGRAIIANVYKYLQEEYSFMKDSNFDNCDLSPLANIRKRTAEATGVSERTITQIRKEAKELPAGSSDFPTPLAKRRKRDSKFDLETLNIDVVRSIIQNYHIEHNAMPSAAKLHSLLREKIDFDGSVSTLRNLLKNMGYKWQNNGNRKQTLQERFELQLWRLKFLKSIDQYRSEGRPIVYIDEAYCIHVRKSTWDVKDKETASMKNLGSGNSFITILHAGSKDGFIPNAKLVYKVCLTNEDYHPDKSFDTYTKWVEETLLPNLPERAVIVMDNVLSCHNAHNTKMPTLNSCKADMQKWLTENGIAFDETLHKIELYDIITECKKSTDRFISYKIDSVIRSEGFDVLRLPPTYPELNPIKKVWKILKDEITSKTIEKNKIAMVEQSIHEALDHIDNSLWYNSCTHIEYIEKEYMKYFEKDFGFEYDVSESDDSESEEREGIDDDE